MAPIEGEMRFLRQRLDRQEDELTALRELPAAVAGLSRGLTAVEEGQRRIERRLDVADEEEVRRVVALRTDLRQMNQKIDDRFDRVDLAHERARGVDWKTVLAVVTGITVPLFVAIVGAIVAFGAPG